MLPGAGQEATTQAIRDAAKGYFSSIAFAQDYVSLARLGEAILGAAGVLDYESLTLNGSVANISVGARQAAVPGEVTVTYV